MPHASFLFDTYAVAERSLCPAVLSEALCTAIRLGKHALEQERQAAFLVPLAQHNSLPSEMISRDEYLAEMLEVCIQRSDETRNGFITRLSQTANLSAIRVTLACLFQQEYGETACDANQARERRKAIRALCRVTPPEVWSDIVQGELKPEDADFLSLPEFTVVQVHAD